jgi:hypothetical protein
MRPHLPEEGFETNEGGENPCYSIASPSVRRLPISPLRAVLFLREVVESVTWIAIP